MKTLLFILTFSLASFAVAQEKQFINLQTLSLGESYANEGITILFDKVISDSRCPKNVNCVRAGEAVVMVSVFEDGDFVTNKKLIIDASGFVHKDNNSAFLSELFSIYAVGLSPYPVFGKEVSQKDYRLEVGLELH